MLSATPSDLLKSPAKPVPIAKSLLIYLPAVNFRVVFVCASGRLAFSRLYPMKRLRLCQEEEIGLRRSGFSDTKVRDRWRHWLRAEIQDIPIMDNVNFHLALLYGAKRHKSKTLSLHPNSLNAWTKVTSPQQLCLSSKIKCHKVLRENKKEAKRRQEFMDFRQHWNTLDLCSHFIPPCVLYNIYPNSVKTLKSLRE